MKLFLIVQSILIGLLAYSMFVDATSQKPPLEQVYKGYNHIRIYEDGSYVGENREGQQEQGCIKVARCNNE